MLALCCPWGPPFPQCHLRKVPKSLGPRQELGGGSLLGLPLLPSQHLLGLQRLLGGEKTGQTSSAWHGPPPLRHPHLPSTLCHEGPGVFVSAGHRAVIRNSDRG